MIKSYVPSTQILTTWKVPVFGVILVRMRKNEDQNNSEHEHLLGSDFQLWFYINSETLVLSFSYTENLQKLSIKPGCGRVLFLVNLKADWLQSFFDYTLKGKFSHFFSQFPRKILNKVRSSLLDFSVKQLIWKFSCIY